MTEPILDACCGSKMFYFDKDDPSVLFQDIRVVETELKDRDHFPDIAEGSVFPVWVRVERINEKV